MSFLSSRFKKSEDRVEYIQAMKTLLPLLYQRVMEILPDASLPSVTLQHHILKIFYATMQVSHIGHRICFYEFVQSVGFGAKLLHFISMKELKQCYWISYTWYYETALNNTRICGFFAAHPMNPQTIQ